MNYEKYYTAEQLDQLEQRRREVGEDRIQQVQQEWTELFAAFGEAMDEGLAPESEQVRTLARKSAALIAEFTRGDPGIAASLSNLYASEGAENVSAQHGMGMKPGLWEYMGKARAALEG